MAFEVRPSDVAELESGPADEVALENAYRKASAIAGAVSEGADGPPLPVLGVDTVVSLGTRIFGKPGDAQDAAAMLGALAGRRHIVVSGVCLIDRKRTRTAAARTAVDFRALDEAAVSAYVATGEWQGRAGGYAIQGRGATLVSGIEGDYLNVVGLPVSTLLDLWPGLLGD